MEQEPDWAADDPEIAALLTFTPVVRKNIRHDGWTPWHQRGFIAWLAATGNVDKAAQAVGRTQSGAWTVRNSIGAEGFANAWEEALALFHARRRAAKQERLRAPPAGERHTPRRARDAREARIFREKAGHRGAGVYTAVGEEEADEAEIEAFLEDLLKRYLIKLRAERRTRLEGRIVEADFYVRQLTCIELMLDIGGRTAAVLELFHRQGLDPIGIAATPGSTLLERARRAFWLEKGEADRPPPAPLGRHDERSATGRDDYDHARDGDYEEWRRRQAEKQRLAAEAQREWEDRARRETGPDNDNNDDDAPDPAA
jgi:hypothetical protein